MFVRADLNVPLDGDDASPTTGGSARRCPPCRSCVRPVRGWWSRPTSAAPKSGADNTKYSLAPVAARLGSLLGTEVALVQHGDKAKARP